MAYGFIFMLYKKNISQNLLTVSDTVSGFSLNWTNQQLIQVNDVYYDFEYIVFHTESKLHVPKCP